MDKGAKEAEVMAAHFDPAKLEPEFGGKGQPDFDLDDFGRWMEEVDARRCSPAS